MTSVSRHNLLSGCPVVTPETYWEESAPNPTLDRCQLPLCCEHLHAYLLPNNPCWANLTGRLSDLRRDGKDAEWAGRRGAE